MLPVAPGGTGQPPSSPKLDSNESHAGLAARRARSRAPARACCGSGRSARPRRRARRAPLRRTLATCRGFAIPVVSPKPTSCAPASTSARAISSDALGRTSPSYGQPKTVEMTPSQRSPSARARASTRSSAGERLLDRAVDVLAVVRLGGAQEDVDLVDAVAVRERVVEPALVRDQHAHAHVVRELDRLQHLGGVGELRDHVGAHEARHLEPPSPCGASCSISRTLSSVGDHLRLVLEAVARADLADARRAPAARLRPPAPARSPSAGPRRSPRRS